MALGGWTALGLVWWFIVGVPVAVLVGRRLRAGQRLAGTPCAYCGCPQGRGHAFDCETRQR